jgi:RimJ/RimL family protein N-acetyltransferase
VAALGAATDPLVRLREAREEDCRLLWEWTNDPEVRTASFSTAPVPWDDHRSWFHSKLADPSCLLYIATDGAGRPIGQVRFDVRGAAAVVSTSLDRRRRGQGYGAAVIRLTSRALFEAAPVEAIHAYVKEDNKASATVFAKAGYTNTGAALVHGQPALRFVLRRGE